MENSFTSFYAMMSEYMLKTVMKRTHHPASTMSESEGFQAKVRKTGQANLQFFLTRF